MSYRINGETDKQKKFCLNAENNTVVATANSNCNIRTCTWKDSK